MLTVECPAFILLHLHKKWLGDIRDIGDTVPSGHSTVKIIGLYVNNASKCFHLLLNSKLSQEWVASFAF